VSWAALKERQSPCSAVSRIHAHAIARRSSRFSVQPTIHPLLHHVVCVLRTVIGEGLITWREDRALQQSNPYNNCTTYNTISQPQQEAYDAGTRPTPCHAMPCHATPSQSMPWVQHGNEPNVYDLPHCHPALSHRRTARCPSPPARCSESWSRHNGRAQAARVHFALHGCTSAAARLTPSNHIESHPSP